MTKVGSGGVAMMLKTGMKVTQDYSVFNYVHPRPQNIENPQEKTKVEGIGFNSSPIVFPGNRKEKFGN